MKKWLVDIFGLLRQTFNEWNADKAPRLAAALAYYTAFSLAPLLVVIIAVVGLVVSQSTIQDQILVQVRNTAGTDAAQMVSDLITNTSKPAEGILSTVLGIVTLLLGAIGVFGQLQDSLNTIWGVSAEVLAKENAGIINQVRNKFLNFGMVLVVGFLLLVSLVISAGLSALNGYVLGLVPGVEFLLQVVNIVISFGAITILFAMIFKFLPKVEIRWRDVWIGSAFTALLFTIGKFALGLYLGRSSTASAYGAAGSFVIILLWIYYSAQILLFGAEFTQVYTRQYGSHADKPVQKVAPRETVLVNDNAAPPRTPITTPKQGTHSLEDAYAVNPNPITPPKRKAGMLPGVIFAIGTFLVALVAGMFQPNKSKDNG